MHFKIDITRRSDNAERSHKSALTMLLCCVVIMMGYALPVAGQHVIHGKVVNEKEEALPYAFIKLLNNKDRQYTNQYGDFIFSHIARDTSQLVVSYVGYQSDTLTFSLRNVDTLHTRVVLKEQLNELEQVVITASRTRQRREDVPVPMTIVGKKEIEEMGAVRLDDVLREQTGLQVLNDHGTALQMQGMDADHILILIDGEPVVGRTAGTLDLKRLAVGNIERVEVMRGPSSALYGSDALAGVVNIITKQPDKKFDAGTTIRYRSMNTLDASANAQMKKNKTEGRVFFNRLSSSGYDMQPEAVGKTFPAFRAYTLETGVGYQLTKNMKASVRLRGYKETQKNSAQAEDLILDQDFTRQELMLTPSFIWEPDSHSKMRLTHHFTTFATSNVYDEKHTGERYDKSDFRQWFDRTELQYDNQWHKAHTFTAGAGYLSENVMAERYEKTENMVTAYAYVQEQWEVRRKLQLQFGLRADQHSVYGHSINPKLSAQYRFSEKFSFRASAGTGFKAPDFRQLLLNFTNPTAGYSVYGSEVAAAEIRRLQGNGEVTTVLRDPDQLEPVRAERSKAFNAGFTLKPAKGVNLTTNVFQNRISDMIETAPVVRKTNGQQAFTYFNLSSVHTSGVEADVAWKAGRYVDISAGYQYLDTRDLDVLEQIDAGKKFARDPKTGEVKRVSREEYGGLFNRSRHSGNVKLTLSYKPAGLSLRTRVMYRGPFGFGDVNGNNMLDASQEYADGYFLTNISLSKNWKNILTTQATIENAGDVTNPYVQGMPGRMYAVAVSYHFPGADDQQQ